MPYLGNGGTHKFRVLQRKLFPPFQALIAVMAFPLLTAFRGWGTLRPPLATGITVGLFGLSFLPPALLRVSQVLSLPARLPRPAICIPASHTGDRSPSME
jgi:hypothetical protein